MKNWMKEHQDTLMILAVVLGGFWNMNNKMWDLNEKMNELDKRVTAIETIMIMQGSPLRALTENYEEK